MSPKVESCPHCGAPLALPSRFAVSVTCAFCDATVRIDPSSVSASKYREAWTDWMNTLPSAPHRFSMDGTQWAAQWLLAHGEISDVYVAKRVRWPSELVLLKTLRDHDDAPLLENEWRVLNHLRTGVHADLHLRVPTPVVMGVLIDPPDGGIACAYRWASGFTHTFERIRQAHPGGIPTVASIWIWRRILEVLAVLRRAGLVHGAILPNHLLAQNGEHGVRVVGFSCAGAPNDPLRLISEQFKGFYPADVLRSGKLSAGMDITMSARCVAYLLGGHDADVPDHLPQKLSDLLRQYAAGTVSDVDPWKLREQAGEIGKALFGPPAFHPIAMA